MATKLTVWDEHSADYPIESLYCSQSDKYLKAVYPLYDSYIGVEECPRESLDVMDFGIFNCGFGENTLNMPKNEDGSPDNRFASARKTIGYQLTPKFTQKGNPRKPRVIKVKNGVTMYGYTKPIRYPDSLLWIVHREKVDGEYRDFLYAPQKLESDGCLTCYGRGIKGYDITGKSWKEILDNCNKDGYTRKEVVETERVIATHDYRGPKKEDWKQYRLSIEFDGQSVLALMALRPKCSFEHLKLILENEGGSVDENGIIHRPVKE